MTLLGDGTWAGRIFTGTWLPGSGLGYPAIEPATGAELAEVGQATAGDVVVAAQRAAVVQTSWAATPAVERAAVLSRAAALFEEHAEEINEWVVRESGSTRLKSGLEVAASIAECREAAALATAPYGELLHSPMPRISMERRIPVGVVSVISPFNFPLILSLRSLAPALALGNAVLLKPDPRTAICGGVLIARVFEEAGLPEGLLQLLPGGVEVGSAMIDAPQVRVVSFTGSTPAGRAIGAQAAKTLTRTHLELGGNSALVVLGDVDVEAAASCGAFGNFVHSGQACMAIGRHLVHESIYDDYVALLAKKADALTVGDGFRADVALGPIIDQKQLNHVKDLVERSVADGARLVAGGTHDGLFYRPTVLADCTSATPAYREEVFGPVACVRPFSTVDEAVVLAADSEYGLALGVLGNDLAAAMAIADRVPAGLVHINDQTFNDDPNAPFGGVRASGTSRVGGARANLECYTDTQWLTLRATAPSYPF
ncbi:MULTISPECIES: aldehyde dehydrogenase family protein [unclassified Crossiella]|uniref:aldehyde dehydrogenase family protein n=1 Tax=unclassified Crossiella TaxID=2620835 RepID=UPI001FFF2E60|nr:MULTISPECIES: aldehyde dehydrogenase family protein [unclassified Crossiella]MCK2244264.1 aldehyde dehydrogenase family protein [Crossiella sp. S99.2]MCK2258068.1 aldehyde dehydrogenase family protein [Crossiella sp. S99.1]